MIQGCKTINTFYYHKQLTKKQSERNHTETCFYYNDIKSPRQTFYVLLGRLFVFELMLQLNPLKHISHKSDSKTPSSPFIFLENPKEMNLKITTMCKSV